MELFNRSVEVDANFLNRTFFHGAKDTADVIEIRRNGFQSEYFDAEESERFFRDGNLGVGNYLSCNWMTGFWFGRVLLESTVVPGTKIFDAGVPADRQVLKQLVREFGREILSDRDPFKVLPRNKKLEFNQFAELMRFHYNGAWPEYKEVTGERRFRWPPSRMRHTDALKRCVSWLKKCGFHGYGNPADDNGLLIFQPERIKLTAVVAEVPAHRHSELIEENVLNGLTLPALRRAYPPARAVAD